MKDWEYFAAAEIRRKDSGGLPQLRAVAFAWVEESKLHLLEPHYANYDPGSSPPYHLFEGDIVTTDSELTFENEDLSIRIVDWDESDLGIPEDLYPFDEWLNKQGRDQGTEFARVKKLVNS